MLDRRIFGVVLAAIALGGCSIVGNQPDSSTSASAPVASGSSSAASPAAASTRVISVQPWSHELLESAQSTVAPEPAKPNYCEPSQITDRPDAYRCYRGDTRFNFCMANPASAIDYACMDAKLGWKILSSVDHTAPPSSPKPVGSPGQYVYLKLTDGTVCSRVSGAGPSPLGDYISPGDCSDQTSFWTRFDRNVVPTDSASPFGEGTDAQGRWLVKTGPAAGPLTTRSVEAAYR